MIIRRIIPCMIIALIANVVCGQDEGEISSDEMQIRAAVEGYLLAINSGDASAAADYWIESGRMVSADGSRLVGRAAIQEDLEEFLRDNAGRQVSVNNVFHSHIDSHRRHRRRRSNDRGFRRGGSVINLSGDSR